MKIKIDRVLRDYPAKLREEYHGTGIGLTYDEYYFSNTRIYPVFVI